MGWNPVRTSQQILSPIVLQREYQWLRRSTMYCLSFLTLVRTTGDNIWSIEYYASRIKQLTVLQTPENHEKITEILSKLRKASSYCVEDRLELFGSTPAK